jgi:redox-sensitive bicupin YhaK (pirin superfamily)
MIHKRKLVHSYKAPIEKGFLGEGHLAQGVISLPYSQSDPFIALMDDMLDKKNNIPSGGPHPHAGFETVSLMLDGAIGDMIENLKVGDFQIMTAGSGIVHTEIINQPTKGRLLQMWLNLPQKERWVTPRVQDLPAEHVPVFNADGLNIRIYSGAMTGLQSPILNYVPLIVAEFEIKPDVSTTQIIPANFNSFIYVIEGNVQVGEEKSILNEGETGWLNLIHEEANSELILKAGSDGVRLIVYAAKPQGEKFASQGPFIGDTEQDIKKVYTKYLQGKLEHIAHTSEKQRIKY